MAPLLDIRDLRVSARADDGGLIPIVKGVSFEVAAGEVVALIGESGSGKTTIGLSALAYVKPGLEFTGGEVQLVGEDVLTMGPAARRDLRGRRVSYVAQSATAAFNPAIRIGEQVIESALLYGALSADEATRRAETLYRILELPEPERVGERYPHQVSGGQLQRLMAAMALCGRPELLVLDEPTTALDVTTQIEVLKAFKQAIREEGAAAIYVTHDLAVVAQVADRIVVLYNGELQESGTAAQVIEAPVHAYTRRLMAAVRPSPEADAGNGPDSTETSPPPVIEACDITAGYGRAPDGGPAVTVLRDVDIRVERGRVVGIIGESGCGKSTLARVIAGLLPPAKGQILLDGTPIAARAPRRTRSELRKVQIVFQMADTALNPRQRVGEILGRPLEFFHGIRGTERRRRVAELLDMVELPRAFDGRFPDELSGGQKQRVNLARALAAEPEVILCDEVTSALDSIVGANIIELLKRLRRDLGVSYVFISHDLSTVASFADSVAVLYAGRVVEQGPLNRVLSPPYHPYTRLLITSVPELSIGWLERSMKTREAAAGIARSVDLTATGCPFFTRCPIAIPDLCDRVAPPLQRPAPGHHLACHRAPEEM